MVRMGFGVFWYVGAMHGSRSISKSMTVKVLEASNNVNSCGPRHGRY